MLKKFVKENESGTKLYLISHHDPLKQMETYIVEFGPDSDSKDIMTPHPGQEFCYVIGGKIEIVLEGKPYLLEMDDSFYFNSNIPHTAKNKYNGTTRVIWVVTPPNI